MKMLEKIIGWAYEMEKYAYNFYFSNGEEKIAEKKKKHLKKLRRFSCNDFSFSEEKIAYLESVYLRFLKDKNEEDFRRKALNFEKDFILFYGLLKDSFLDDKIFGEFLKEEKIFLRYFSSKIRES